jgi:uncharacterized phage protein (TIGR01671 family)
MENELTRIDFAAGYRQHDATAFDETGTQIAEFQLSQLMQFTGLHDKNGKEIYEGDIVRYFHDDEAIVEVRWWNELAQFAIAWRSQRIKSLRGCDSEPILINTNIDGEVIGNIYENPELLK